VKRELVIGAAVVAAAIGVAVADESRGVRTWLELRRDLRVAQARVAELETRIESRESEVEALRSDPFALEQAIREDLGLARPGETVVRGLSGTPRNP
jgi:cell division protein FtsB